MKLYAHLLATSLTIILIGCGGGSNSKADPTPIPTSSSSKSSEASSSTTSSSIASSVISSSSTSSASSSSTSSSASACTTQECETRNKELVLKIYTDVINGGETELVNSIFDTNLILHLTAANNGPTGEISHLQTLQNDTPGYIATVKHIAADGDYVAVHWHLSTTPNNEFNGKAVVDLYKLSGTKIVEHWYIAENLNANTASGNSLFSNLYLYITVKPTATQESEAANKQLVTSTYLGLFNDKNLALVDQYIDPNYLQHNPYVPNGREPFRTFVTARTAGGLSFFATVADDDLVWTFGGNDSLKLVDMFRVDNKKIVEHYDVF